MNHYKISLSRLLGATLFFGVLSNGFAVLPPKYLGVQDFQKCLATKNMGTWQSWCMPATKPETCPAASWKQLHNFIEKDSVPQC